MDGETGAVGLQQDGFDPNTVFKIHPLHGENGFIEDDKLVRFEHVLSGRWLHGDDGKTCCYIFKEGQIEMAES